MFVKKENKPNLKRKIYKKKLFQTINKYSNSIEII